MTVEATPWAFDAQSTDSDVARHALQAVLGGAVGTFAGGVAATRTFAHGVCGPDDLDVSQSLTPAMTVRVAAGTAFITGTASAGQGPYSFYNDAAVDNLAISPGDATNPRNDIVCAQTRDTDFDASGAKGNRLFVVEGTPAGSPLDPALPAGCLALARVVVAANESTSIVNADITDIRTKGGTWGLPRGPVADPAELLATSTGYNSTVSDVTGLTITWTADTSRKYRTTVDLPSLVQNTSAGLVELRITDAANSATQRHFFDAAAAQDFTLQCVRPLETSLSGSTTRKARLLTSAGTVDVVGSSQIRNSIIVEDIGGRNRHLGI